MNTPRLSALLALVAGCLPGPRQRALPPPTVLAPAAEEVRLILIGDTGAVRGTPPGDPDACDPSDPHLVVSADCRAALIRRMREDHADAIVALGDLVYFAGPTCPGGLDPDARSRLDAVLGDYLGAVGPPVLLALGNHDLAQRRGRPAALRCYREYAADHPRLVFPERTHVARIGPVAIVVLDSNRPPRGPLLDTLVETVRAHRQAHADAWVVVAAHHPIRTYRDNALRPQKMRRWLARSGLDPDLYAQGHAHFLQFAEIDGVPTVTSGAGAKSLGIRTCRDGEGACGDGERFSHTGFGYVAVGLSDDALTLRFTGLDGALWTWRRER